MWRPFWVTDPLVWLHHELQEHRILQQWSQVQTVVSLNWMRGLHFCPSVAQSHLIFDYIKDSKKLLHVRTHFYFSAITSDAPPSLWTDFNCHDQCIGLWRWSKSALSFVLLWHTNSSYYWQISNYLDSADRWGTEQGVQNSTVEPNLWGWI